jgi:alkylation response protein AidB-like acyl-CoA dehydrogenase
MNFEFTDDQRAIKRTAHEFLAERYRPELVRELAADERGFTDAQWQAVAELGWPGVIVSEADGGLGLGVVELIVIEEELGYALAPTPLLSTASAALVLAAAGSPEQRQRWLPALAGGDVLGALAVWDERGAPPPGGSTVRVHSDGTLTATLLAVPDAAGAGVFVVAGADDVHFVVDAGASGIEISPQAPLDPTRKLARVSFSATPAEPLTGGDGAAVARAYATIATAMAAESVGVGQRTMEMAVAYAKDRKQFGRPIGSYQAVSHRCAQMLLEIEGARSLTYGAAWALDHDHDTALRAASMAKAYAGDAGYRVSASALQVHGGIGFTWEHDLHFFLKRAVANAHSFGDARWHRERVIALAGV